ncbi:partial serine/threonine-protein kinase RsbT, partial [Gammaproteobacteria bacterium]
GLAIVLDVHNLPEPIDALVSTTVFRIVQEALTNVVRHAEATEVSVDLVGDESGLSLTIRDDGKGIDAAAVEGHQALGILGMRERVHLLGGSFRIEGEPGRGTTIRVEVPREPVTSGEPGA